MLFFMSISCLFLLVSFVDRESLYPDYDSSFSKVFEKQVNDSTLVFRMKYLGVIEIPSLYGYSRVEYSMDRLGRPIRVKYMRKAQQYENVYGIHEYCMKYHEVGDTFIVLQKGYNEEGELAHLEANGHSVLVKSKTFFVQNQPLKSIFYEGNDSVVVEGQRLPFRFQHAFLQMFDHRSVPHWLSK